MELRRYHSEVVERDLEIWTSHPEQFYALEAIARNRAIYSDATLLSPPSLRGEGSFNWLGENHSGWDWDVKVRQTEKVWE